MDYINCIHCIDLIDCNYYIYWRSENNRFPTDWQTIPFSRDAIAHLQMCSFLFWLKIYKCVQVKPMFPQSEAGRKHQALALSGKLHQNSTKGIFYAHLHCWFSSRYVQQKTKTKSSDFLGARLNAFTKKFSKNHFSDALIAFTGQCDDLPSLLPFVQVVRWFLMINIFLKK